jgi:hypothetical protein
MKAKEIYHVLQSIVAPIHAHQDQMVAIAKWIESEFEYKPEKVVHVLPNTKPEWLTDEIQKEVKILWKYLDANSKAKCIFIIREAYRGDSESKPTLKESMQIIKEYCL